MRSIIAIVVVFQLLLKPSLVVGEQLDTITVTGWHAAKVGEVEQSEFTGSTEHVSREQISREQGSIASLVAHEAGIQHRQAGAAGSYATITVRAATASQTNVYFDGVLLNNATNGGVDLSQLELLNLENIEIYKGSTPLQLGASSIGGAVNLRSRLHTADTTQVLLGIGSFDEQKAQFSHHFNTLGWNMTALASHVSSDNDFKFTNDFGTPLNSSTNLRQRRNNSEFSRQALLFKVGKQVSGSQRYDGLLQVSARKQALPDWLNRSNTTTSFETDTLQIQLNRRSNAVNAGHWNHTEGLFFNLGDELYDDTQSQLGLGAQNTLASNRVFGVRSYWERVGETSTLALNLDLRHESLDHSNRLNSDEDYSATRNGINGAGQYSRFGYDDTLLLTMALRFEGIADSYDGVLRQGSSTRNNTRLTPQLGVRWQHSDSVTFTGNLGLHDREPVFLELFGDRGIFIGNSDLVAEEGLNADLGAHWSMGNRATANERAVSLTAFASLRDELIVRVYDSRNIGRSVNSGKAKVFGVEASLDWQWNSHWHSRLSLTAQSATNESSVTAFNGKQLPGEAQFVGFASLQYWRDPWRIWYEGDLVQDRYYDTANFLPAEDHFIHGLGLSYSRRKFVTSLSVKNIGDDNIEDFNGYPRPGTSIHLNVKYNLKGY